MNCLQILPPPGDAGLSDGGTGRSRDRTSRFARALQNRSSSVHSDSRRCRGGLGILLPFAAGERQERCGSCSGTARLSYDNWFYDTYVKE
jgi:hypothetical protein